MKKPEPITKEEWLAELEALAAPKGSEGRTSAEMADESGRPQRHICKLLNRAKAAGLLTVSRGVRTSLCGATVTVPVYQIKGKGKRP